MKIKKVLTANLKPGMVSSEAAYTYTNHLVSIVFVYGKNDRSLC